MTEEKVLSYYPCEVVKDHECKLKEELKHKCAFSYESGRSGCEYARSFGRKLMYEAGLRNKIDVFVEGDKRVILQSGNQKIIVEQGRIITPQKGMLALRLQEHEEREAKNNS